RMRALVTTLSPVEGTVPFRRGSANRGETARRGEPEVISLRNFSDRSSLGSPSNEQGTQKAKTFHVLQPDLSIQTYNLPEPPFLAVSQGGVHERAPGTPFPASSRGSRSTHRAVPIPACHRRRRARGTVRDGAVSVRVPVSPGGH